MWLYIQSSGELYKAGVNGLPHQLETKGGYSGYLGGQNDPSANCDQSYGPIPRGFYEILKPRDIVISADRKLIYAMPLIPSPDNDMCDPPRDNFLIHGDSKYLPGMAPRTASAGCIIFPPNIRSRIWDSGDHQLRVTDFLVYP